MNVYPPPDDAESEGSVYAGELSPIYRSDYEEEAGEDVQAAEPSLAYDAVQPAAGDQGPGPDAVEPFADEPAVVGASQNEEQGKNSISHIISFVVFPNVYHVIVASYMYLITLFIAEEFKPRNMSDLCPICLSGQAAFLLIPCKHMGVCAKCASRHSPCPGSHKKPCPFCRKKVEGVIGPVFYQLHDPDTSDEE